MVISVQRKWDISSPAVGDNNKSEVERAALSIVNNRWSHAPFLQEATSPSPSAPVIFSFANKTFVDLHHFARTADEGRSLEEVFHHAVSDSCEESPYSFRVKGLLSCCLCDGEGVAVVPKDFQEGYERDLSSLHDAASPDRSSLPYLRRASPTESIAEVVAGSIH